MIGPPCVVVDACVLVKSAVCDVFMDLAQSGIISLHWTPEIGSEFVKNWPKLRFAQAQRKRRESNSAELNGFQADAELARLGDKARDRLFKFGLMVPEWIIPGWVDEPTAEAIYARTLFNLGAPKYEGVDPKDYHVALAALTLKDAFEPAQDEVETKPRETWLLTENLADLPPNILSGLGVWSVPPGVALEELNKVDPIGVALSLEKTRSDWRAPPVSMENMLRLLEDPAQFGSPEMKHAMARRWAA